MINDTSGRNQAIVSGKIVDELKFSHEIYGEGFYYFKLDVCRLSGANDLIPVMVSERLADKEEYKTGRYVKIEGQFRSYNLTGPSGVHLQLMVFAREIEFADDELPEKDINTVLLDGFVCKPPVYRTTPFNREIGDILLAVNRAYNKSDYIPCILWGRNARFAGKLKVGENVRVTGRIQSRTYQKKKDNGETVEKTAYELSVSRIEIVRPGEEYEDVTGQEDPPKE
ncbi:MAG: single-stranded DNA-binding protein [Clostridia bacterium]|nr:single-stranded DNA-binding protein [Clostridia bacterium]